MVIDIETIFAGSAVDFSRQGLGTQRRSRYPDSVDLRICPIGSAVEVQWLDLDPDERARMRELGIREGTVIHVVNCGAFGSKVVAIGSDRFAIDGRTCSCIAVIPHDAAPVVGSRDLSAQPAVQPSQAPPTPASQVTAP